MSFREFLLAENTQEIVGLGFPRVVADVIQRRFGKHAYQIAKWNKDYIGRADDLHWWYSWRGGEEGLQNRVRLYEASSDPERYTATYKDIHHRPPKKIPDERAKAEMLRAIELDLMGTAFFRHYPFIKEIKSGTLTDLAPYRKLSFEEANQKYERKKVFRERPPVVAYGNGWRWIDTGRSCAFVGDAMRNCGSVGLMSRDPSATMLVLFDDGDRPHVVATHSPEEKKIGRIEGVASTPIKDKYADYVIDLASRLGAKIDTRGTKSKNVKMKWFFGPESQVETLLRDESSPDLTTFHVKAGGKEYYSNSFYAISVEDFARLENHWKSTNKFGSDVDRMEMIKRALSVSSKTELPGIEVMTLPDERTDY